MDKNLKVIDLTHTLSSEVPTWDGGCGFEMSLTLDYKDSTPPYLFKKHKLKMESGIGTHMDAPAHCVPGGKTIDQLEMKDLATDCVVIDVSDEANENYVAMPEVVEKFEKEHGEIKANSFVIFYTGWDKYWATPEKYRNNHKFPSIHESTAQLLLKRSVAGLGIDTLSADTGEDGFKVHNAILGAGKYLVENIANASVLPPTGAKSLVLPMKIKDGTEAPIRLIALL
jgi:kynurenine formamidase